MISKGFKETDIGLIPEDWDVKELNFFLDLLTYGFTNPMPTVEDGPYLITAKNVNNGKIMYSECRRTTEDAFNNLLTDKSRPKLKDILVTKDGTLGRIGFVDKFNCCINQSVALLRPNNRIIPKFLKYLLESPYYQSKMKLDARGTTIQHIQITVLKKMEVAIPPKSEQKKILNIISKLDDKINLNQQMNQTLEKISQVIFEYWFMHFEFPDDNGLPYKSSGGEMVDSDLGEIPLGWDVKKLKKCIDIIIDHRGKTPTKLGFKWSSKGFRALSAKNIKNGKIVNEKSIRFVEDKLYFKWMKNPIQREDILLTSEAPLGEIISWDYDEKIVLSQRLFGIRADQNVIYPKYLYCFMNSSLFKYELKSRATGSTVQGIRQAELLKTNILVPPLELTYNFQKLIKPIFNKITSNEKESKSLSQIRDSLLPKLMSGKIRVNIHKEASAK